MAIKFVTDLNLQQNELQNVAFQRLTTAPATPVQGQMYFNTTDKRLWLYDGEKWVDASSQGDYVFEKGLTEGTDRHVTLDVATASALGGVKVGTNVDVAADGTISVKTASKDDLGLMKVGTNLDVTDGVVSVKTSNGADTLGLVKAGTNVTIAEGVVSVATAEGATTLGVVKAGTNVSIAEGAVSVATADGATLGVVKEGTNVTIKEGAVSVATADSKGTLGLVKQGTNVSIADDGTLTVATADGASTLGLVKQGANVSIEEGVVSVADGTQAVKGVVRLASDSEAAAGTDKTVAVTPYGLSAYVTEAIKDKIELTDLSVADGETALSYDPSKGEFHTNYATTTANGVVKLAAAVADDESGVVNGDQVHDFVMAQNYITLAEARAGLSVAVANANHASYDTSTGVLSLAVDSAPTADSNKLVESGGVKAELDKKADLVAQTAADKFGVVRQNEQGIVVGAESVNFGSYDADYTHNVATLGSDGKVPSAQLPSYVDDVIILASRDAFPVQGEEGKIYVAADTNKTYRWTDGGEGVAGQYVEIGNSLDYATEAEAIAGVENTKIMTALRVNEAIAQGTATLTNKSFDANATGNSISNLEVEDFADGVVQTEVRTVATSSDAALVSEKAVATALDTVIARGVHRVVTLNPTLVPTSGVATWNITETGFDADCEVQIKEVATGAMVFADVACGVGTVTITMNATSAIAEGTYKAIIMGINA